MMAAFGAGLERVVFWLLLTGGSVWSGLARYVQFQGPKRWIALGLLGVTLAAVALSRQSGRWPAWAALAVAALLVGLWYQSIKPRQDRDWAPELSRNLRASVAGDMVTLHDIRDFAWVSETEADRRWRDESFDLNTLASVEMATSVWSSPKIAHLLVSFGFTDGRHVAFSAEIRREASEEFSELGGFFRQFELALIGATEDDILKLRTHARGETVSLFPVDLNAADRRALFETYVHLAQSLERAPAFYNTLTANCTTVVWRMGRMLDPTLPLGAGLLLSGYLPSYMEKLGLLGGTGSVEQKQKAAELNPVEIDARMAKGMSYSEAIRVKRSLAK